MKTNTVSKLADPSVVNSSTNLSHLPVEQPTAPVYNSDSVKLLVSLRDAHITYDGQVTGKHYAWNRAGSVQEVDALDAPYLLEKRIKTQSCCAVNDTAIFQQID